MRYLFGLLLFSAVPYVHAQTAEKGKGLPSESVRETQELTLESELRESRLKVRRLRRRLRKARDAEDSEALARLKTQLHQAKEDQRHTRKKLREAVAAGDVSQNYGHLKKGIRDDLNAVRRARYALKKAIRRSDNRAAQKAKERLLSAKRRLKRSRRALRGHMRSHREAPLRRRKGGHP